MRQTFEEYLDTIRQLCAAEGYDSLDETFVAHLRARFRKQPVVIADGARIRLRELQMTDLDKLYAFPNAACEPVLEALLKQSYEESAAYLQAYIEHMYPVYDYGIWAVEDKEKDALLGLCGIGQAEINGEVCADLGYYICPEKRRQGFAAEAVALVLDYAKNYLEFPVIYAIIKEENRISADLLHKFGFLADHRCEDGQVYRKKLQDKERS